MKDLARYTVSMDQRLLEKFDEWIAGRGYANRSEAIRDLIRDVLVGDEWAEAGRRVAATVTVVYDHHTPLVAERLDELQHHHCQIVVSATHVHLDDENCLEVIILRGKSASVKALAEEIVALKGVKHGKIVCTTEGRQLY